MNLEYVTWQRQDQLLVSWLLSSMSESILPQMVGCNIATDIWRTLNKVFAIRCKAKIMQYKLQIQSLKKSSLTMREYLLKMKMYYDTTTSIRHQILEEDQILYIFAGLSIKYDFVVSVITSRVESHSLKDVQGLLLAQEIELSSIW